MLCTRFPTPNTSWKHCAAIVQFSVFFDRRKLRLNSPINGPMSIAVHSLPIEIVAVVGLRLRILDPHVLCEKTLALSWMTDSQVVSVGWLTVLLGGGQLSNCSNLLIICSPSTIFIRLFQTPQIQVHLRSQSLDYSLFNKFLLSARCTFAKLLSRMQRNLPFQTY